MAHHHGTGFAFSSLKEVCILCLNVKDIRWIQLFLEKFWKYETYNVLSNNKSFLNFKFQDFNRASEIYFGHIVQGISHKYWSAIWKMLENQYVFFSYPLSSHVDILNVYQHRRRGNRYMRANVQQVGTRKLKQNDNGINSKTQLKQCSYERLRIFWKNAYMKS